MSGIGVRVPLSGDTPVIITHGTYNQHVSLNFAGGITLSFDNPDEARRFLVGAFDALEPYLRDYPTDRYSTPVGDAG